MRHILTILVILLLSSGIAYADKTSHKKLAVQLLRIYEKDIDLSYSIPHEVDNVIRRDPKLQPFRQQLITFMEKYLSSRQLKGYLVQAFMHDFPEGKLREIVRFLSSPAGKLWIEKSSRFDKTIDAIIRSIFERHQNELMTMFKHQGNP